MAVRICGWRPRQWYHSESPLLRTSTVLSVLNLFMILVSGSTTDTARVAEGCAIPPISARQQSGSPVFRHRSVVLVLYSSWRAQTWGRFSRVSASCSRHGCKVSSWDMDTAVPMKSQRCDKRRARGLFLSSSSHHSMVPCKWQERKMG